MREKAAESLRRFQCDVLVVTITFGNRVNNNELGAKWASIQGVSVS